MFESRFPRGGMLLLLVLKDVALGGPGAGSSDNVGHRGHFRVSGVNPLFRSVVLDLWMGTVQGIYPWVSTLVMRNLMGRRFGVGRGCFFWGGEGEGKRNSRVRPVETFSQDDASSKQPGCMLYIIC